MIIDLVIGCRPNFVKAAAIIHAAKQYPNVTINLVHTGQHVGDMSDPFFNDLELSVPTPHRSFLCHDFLTIIDRLSRMIEWLGTVFNEDKPNFVMVVGDTDSTLAGAIAAAKLTIPLIHVEAGLRCGNMNMQEEINRILIDSVSTVCYTTTIRHRDTLIAEGHDPQSVKFVGNVMVDTLYRFLDQARGLYPRPTHLNGPYAILTLHRAENVDDDKVIFPMLDAVREIAEEIDVIFPIHPRLKSRIGAWNNNGRFLFEEPMSYLKFIALLSRAKFVMTDSGGLQEETTALGIPCLTLRNETERLETIWEGTNSLVGIDPSVILARGQGLIDRTEIFEYQKPVLWDGHAADRIFADLIGGSYA
jgi:UDP-N-acetylglucosamine 2-epimerase (non-hydrolysing)